MKYLYSICAVILSSIIAFIICYLGYLFNVETPAIFYAGWTSCDIYYSVYSYLKEKDNEIKNWLKDKKQNIIIIYHTYFH